MIVVLDASAAIELLLKRPHSAAIKDALDQADHIIVPDLYVAEVSNAIWKLETAVGDRILPQELLDDAMELPDEILASTDIFHEAYAFSMKHGHPVYDSLYAIAARRNGAALLTLDRRLASLALSEGLAVIPNPK